MALTIDALKGLYEKLGGEDFGDVTTIPEAIDKVTSVASSGGGDTYETVAEIEVGTMEPFGDFAGFYRSITAIDKIPFSVKSSDVFYFGNSENNSDVIETNSDNTETAILFNADNFETLSPIDQSKNVYLIQWVIEDGEGDDSSIAIMANTLDIENTTVKILKKVSGGGNN